MGHLRDFAASNTIVATIKSPNKCIGTDAPNAVASACHTRPKVEFRANHASHAAGLSGFAPSQSKADLSAAITPTSVSGKIAKTRCIALIH